MAIHYFVWNDTDSRNKHIRVPGRIQITKPEERVQQITIPGRAGDLTETEGENIFNSYIQSVDISIDGIENVHDAETWLTGDGYVTFDNEPERKQAARIYGALQLNKHSRNVDKWKGTVQFYCSPIKQDTNEQAITVTVSGTGINNPGDMTAFPRIEITGSGAVTIACGGKTLVIPECQNGWIVDSENEWILQGTTPQEKACSGEFPILQKGANTITFTGNVTQLLVVPRFRYL